MGILAHFVGDAAQPLHTTKHHHGWKGDNPNGYTTENSIHAYIDGGVIKTQRIDAEGVSLCDLAVAQYGVRVDKRSECVRLAWERLNSP